MAEAGSITQLFTEAADDLDAFAQLHDRLRPAIVDRARQKLEFAPLRHVDAEDVAQVVFFEFAKSLQEGRLVRIVNRDQLMAFLTSIAIKRAINEIKSELREKRDARRNVYPEALDVLCDRGTTPEQQAIVDDCLDFYIGRLPEQLRQVAEMHLAGLEKHEIADRMGWTVKTVERKRKLLRDQWQALVSDSVNRDVTKLLPEKK